VNSDRECLLKLFDVAGDAIICRRFQDRKSRDAALPIGNSVSIGTSDINRKEDFYENRSET
jgi:hypothetical protein